MKHCITLAHMLSIIVCLGCSSKPCPAEGVTAPFVSVLVPLSRGRVAEGQAVVFDGRLLSAGHVFFHAGEPHSRYIKLGETWTSLRVHGHGERDVLEQLYAPAKELSERDFASDWYMAELVSVSTDTEANMPYTMRLPTRPLADGARLWVWRSNPYTAQSECFAAHVRETLDCEQGTILLIHADRDVDTRGWSGAFAGRYDCEESTWEFVGILVAENHNTSHKAVLVPPRDVSEWLLGGSVESGCATDRRVALGSAVSEGVVPVISSR